MVCSAMDQCFCPVRVRKPQVVRSNRIAGSKFQSLVLLVPTRTWAIVEALEVETASYGYWWIHALLKRHELAYNPKKVWRVMRGHGWLATGRRSRARDGRRHEGQVRGGRTESAVGLGHHQLPGVEWTEGTHGHHDRLRGPNGVGVAFCLAHHGPRIWPRCYGRLCSGGSGKCGPKHGRSSSSATMGRSIRRIGSGRLCGR